MSKGGLSLTDLVVLNIMTNPSGGQSGGGCDGGEWAGAFVFYGICAIFLPWVSSFGLGLLIGLFAILWFRDSQRGIRRFVTCLIWIGLGLWLCCFCIAHWIEINPAAWNEYWHNFYLTGDWCG